MEKILLRCLYTVVAITLLSVSALAQKETFDLISYTAPKGWTKEVKENLISYTITNKQNNSWCQAGIIKSTISKGSIEKDFESEWQELIVKMYKPTEAPQLDEVQEKDGWKIKAGSAKFKFNNADAVVILTTASGYERCVSIVIITNSQEYLKDIETILSSVDITKPAVNPTPQGNVADKTSLIGTWAANASNNSDSRMASGTMNYSKRQYSFFANGTYSFVSKGFDPLMNNNLLGKETGTYQISGNTVTVIPTKSVLEAWTKKNGTDDWGKMVSTQNIPLEKVSYQFTKHYFSGIDEWNLVLQADKTTQRDGPFSNNTSYSNAWYYRPIASNNPVIDLPPGQKISTEEIKTEPVKQTTNGKFAFTISNFDDGWTSTVQEDWVQVTKGTLKVLIHYPNKSADEYNSVLLDGLKNAWNVLVVPKYKTVSNVEFKPVSSWESVEFAEADAVEKASGKSVRVVLFKKNYSGGNGRFLEFVTPDKASFEKEFGPYHATTSDWDKMEKMANYNRFAVAASDLTGKWTNNFSGTTQYVNVNTGLDAGMDTHASVQNFKFGPGATYNWDLAVASGMVGNIKFQSVKSSGKFSMNGNWKINFSDIEGKPRTYDICFSCIKGLRILWIDGTAYAKAE
jgi:hypothetical protein